MLNLHDLQVAMSQNLRHESGAPMPLVTARGVTAAAAFEISRSNFYGTLVNALLTSFPAVSSLVGRHFFDRVATVFVRNLPPRSSWLDSYGASFPAFLDTLAVLDPLPYIAEVAKLEWMINLALHAHDEGAAQIGVRDIEALAGLDDDAAGNICLHPAPSFGLLHTMYPSDAIWSAVLALDVGGATVPGNSAAALAAIDLQSGPVWLCISRQEHGVDVRRMSERAWRFATALRDGAALSAAASHAGGVDGLDDDIATLLATHLHQRHFTSFSITAAH